MKNNFLLLGFISFLMAFTIQLPTEIMDAIKAGNATELAKHLDSTIEINLSGKSNSYSKKQAELVIREFFNTNQVKNFTIIHKSETSNSQYFIGKLTTENGDFRTTIYLKQKGKKILVQEIRFEK